MEEAVLRENMVDLDWDLSDSKAEKLHSIHPYPAKFIPELPRQILTQLSFPDECIVFDPFCGSGVTLTEAQKIGYKSVGVDLNPIAALLSRVKTCDKQLKIYDHALKVVNISQLNFHSVDVPLIKNLGHWFKRDIQRAVAALLSKIKTTDNDFLKDALNFCVSANLVRVSNQDSDTRYAAVSKNVCADDVFALFLRTAKKLEEAKNQQLISAPSKVLNKNSLLLNKTNLPSKIGITITSPPYPNAYEYWLYHKYRMWWLGYDAQKIKDDEIGARPHYFKKNHQTEHDFINQMNQLFKFLYNNSVRGAYSVFIIGRSKIHGKIINNEQIILNCGKENGFEHIATYERNIKSSRKSFNLSHARIKKEYIVIHKKL